MRFLRRGIISWRWRPRTTCVKGSCRRPFASAASSAESSPGQSPVGATAFNILRKYEDLIGLTAVKEAQGKAIFAETKFSECQQLRRGKQEELNGVQRGLKRVHQELDKTSRGQDKYLDLLTEEHRMIKEEQRLIQEFEGLEMGERRQFSEFSQLLRAGHEKERERGERTKYWSLIGSALGALIGILGTALNNRLRMRELRKLVTDSADPSRLRQVLAELSELVRSQQEQVKTFVEDVRTLLNCPRGDGEKLGESPQASAGELLSEHSERILAALRERDRRLDSELEAIKGLIAAGSADGSIVYVGPQMQTLLEQTEKNLEWKMKIQSLVNVVIIYAALGISVSLLASLFRGS